MTEALNARALDYALQRVQDFALLNLTRNQDDKAEAVDIWLDSLGLSEPLRSKFKTWVEGFAPDHEGAVYLGFTVGLFVHQFYQDGNE